VEADGGCWGEGEGDEDGEGEGAQPARINTRRAVISSNILFFIITHPAIGLYQAGRLVILAGIKAFLPFYHLFAGLYKRRSNQHRF
jgi:hypothetical protein